ncbi:MAG: ribulose-phosphate 3-epimerase [Ruminococcus sp.]|nr:ribulose-phosphate 3-epimerase [Ruminococcus sp.]
MRNLVAASLLASDFFNLSNDIVRAESAGVDWIHYDVMDGSFVPSISFGEPVLLSISKHISIPIDVHLMIVNPISHVEKYAALGADSITVHIEAAEDIEPTLDKIRSLGCKVGLSVKPDTPISAVKPYLSKVDMLLVMTVEPGFGGQKFLPHTLEKVKQARALADESSRELRVQVDGGINGETAQLVRQSGADVLVSGSYLFKAQSMSRAVEILRGE